jgi:hypothetical protein
MLFVARGNIRSDFLFHASMHDRIDRSYRRIIYPSIYINLYGIAFVNDNRMISIIRVSCPESVDYFKKYQQT